MQKERRKIDFNGKLPTDENGHKLSASNPREREYENLFQLHKLRMHEIRELKKFMKNLK